MFLMTNKMFSFICLMVNILLQSEACFMPHNPPISGYYQVPHSPYGSIPNNYVQPIKPVNPNYIQTAGKLPSSYLQYSGNIPVNYVQYPGQHSSYIPTTYVQPAAHVVPQQFLVSGQSYTPVRYPTGTWQMSYWKPATSAASNYANPNTVYPNYITNNGYTPVMLQSSNHPNSGHLLTQGSPVTKTNGNLSPIRHKKSLYTNHSNPKEMSALIQSFRSKPMGVFQAAMANLMSNAKLASQLKMILKLLATHIRVLHDISKNHLQASKV